MISSTGGRNYGLGKRNLGLGYGNHILGCRNHGLGYRNHGLGCQNHGLGYQNLGLGYRNHGLSCRNHGLGCRNHALGNRNHGLGQPKPCLAGSTHLACHIIGMGGGGQWPTSLRHRHFRDAPVRARVPAGTATKCGHWESPLHRRSPNDPART